MPTERAALASALAPLPRVFFARPTVRVARELLGKLLVRRIAAVPGEAPASPDAGSRLVIARIVEVEAYLGERDAASHARRGPTPRTKIMFGPAGYLYVYLIYGMHHCMNFVTERDGQAGAVLIRAAEPVLAPALPGAAATLNGPGKLCRELSITMRQNGLDLTAGGELFVAAAQGPAPRVASSPRIGVDYAGDWVARKLRFYVPANRHVSGKPAR